MSDKVAEAIATLDALTIARESLALGGADVDECTVNTLARAVIAQAEELERVKAGLREALDGWLGARESEGLGDCPRIVELRLLL